MLAIVWMAAAASLRAAASASPPPGTIPLAGTWRFALDRADEGLRGQWQLRSLTGRVRLPGACQYQGYGDPVTAATKWTAWIPGDGSWFTSPRFAPYRGPGPVKVPWWLQPERTYVGAAWYQRSVTIPPAWRGRRVVLTLERPHWETRVWIDGRFAGSNDSLSVAHSYDLGAGLAPGSHTLTVRVDNRLIVDVGNSAHSVSDQTQGNWNGIVGRMELRAGHATRVDDVQVYPHVTSHSITVKGTIGTLAGRGRSGRITVSAVLLRPEGSGRRNDPSSITSNVRITWSGDVGRFELQLALGPKAKTWDEFDPALYRLTVTPAGGDARSVRFGLREIGVRDRMFTINGRKTFLRGTLECCIFPLTGYPPTDVAAWKRIIRICKAHGLNHIRFHSWCPPEAAFEAADELGFYYQVEVAAWTAVGDGKPIDGWLYAEAARILKAYGNHPSFILMPYGNEPGGANASRWLGEFVEHWKSVDPRRLYTSASGWPQIGANQYHVTPGPRGPSGWSGQDYTSAVKSFDVPAVVHEMGQWCVYPSFAEIGKYKGALKAHNLEIFRDFLAGSGMLSQAGDFLRASGRLQLLCYKEEIEAAMRTPGVSGVQLLDLHDFPGQGTSLVGILDAFWDEKGYVKPEEFRRFYGATVPLLRMKRQTWRSNETFTADLELLHAGPAPLRSAAPYWRLEDARGVALLSGAFPPRAIPVDRGIRIGTIRIDLSRLHAPGQYRLTAGLSGLGVENDWRIWIYPADPLPLPAPGLLVATALTPEALQRLDAGGRVLLATTRLGPEHPRGSFTPIFWNRLMFYTQQCRTLGLLVDERHPALRDFPTSFHSDWQWAEIIGRSRCVVMTDLPRELKPIVQVIDDWNTSRKLGLLFECRVGRGKLLVCSADLTTDLENRPAAQQLRRALAVYAASGAFDPEVTVSRDAIARLLSAAASSNLARMGAAVVDVDSEDRANGNVAANAIDGDPDTFWHTRWVPAYDPMPHRLVIDMRRSVSVKGITYRSRQDMANGRVGECEVYLSTDGKTWGAPVARGRFSNTDLPQTLTLDAPTAGRFLKFVIMSEVSGAPFAAVGELDVVL
jgi:hypothetical protein